MTYAATQPYDVVGNREDLTDILINATPKETYLVSNARRTKASNIKHEWQTDSLASVNTSNAQTYGAMITASFGSAAARTRVSAYCQLMDKLVATADQQNDSNPAGFSGTEHEYQIAKRMKELARDMEYMYLNQTSATGDDTTAAKLTGLQQAITTNINSATATRDYTYAIHQSLSETIANSGGRPDVMYFKSAVAVDLTAHPASTGGGSGAVVISVPANEITDRYDMYRDMFGVKKLVPNIGNFAVTTATASAGLYQIQMDIVAQAFLGSGVTVEPIARLGHATNSMISVCVALEFGNELCHGDAKQIAN